MQATMQLCKHVAVKTFEFSQMATSILKQAGIVPENNFWF